METTTIVRHQRNYNPKGAFRETFKLPALTVPDQTLSIREILDRFARGIPMENVAKIPSYDGEENELPDIRTLDLAEIQAYAQEAEDLRNKFEQSREAQERAKQDAEAKRVADLENAARELAELKAKSTNIP